LTNVNGNLFYQAGDTAHGSELHEVAGGDVPTPTPLEVHIAGDFDIDEGDPTQVKFKVTVTGGSAKTFVWDFGDGTHATVTVSSPVTARTFYHAYTHSNPGAYTAKCTVTGANGSAGLGRAHLAIHNVAPVLTVTESSFNVVPYLPVTFTAHIKDPGVNDKFTLHWNFGDGTPTVVQTVGTVDQVSITHAYTKVNTDPEISVSVVDQFGGYDHSGTLVSVRKTAKVDLGNGKEALLIGTPPGNHTIEVKTSGNDVNVIIDGQLQDFVSQDVLKGILIAKGPHDKLTLSSSLDDITTVYNEKI
jgi:PKD repeat protein